jgi:hypothetical protein
MQPGHAFNVIAMLQMLATQGTLQMLANLAAGSAGRHEHDQQPQE